jgi:hypothetical protein
MDWQTQLKGGTLPWLLETSTPEVRYLALRALRVLKATNEK